jgi:hypothetical protein
LSDKFDNKGNGFDNSNEIDEFLKQFDEIKKNFIAVDGEAKDPGVPARNHNNSAETDTMVFSRWEKRLNRTGDEGVDRNFDERLSRPPGSPLDGQLQCRSVNSHGFDGRTGLPCTRCPIVQELSAETSAAGHCLDGSGLVIHYDH